MSAPGPLAGEGPAAMIVSTLHYPGRAAWSSRVRTVDPSRPRAAVLRELVRSLPHAGALVLNGHSPVDLAAAAIARRRRRPPWVVLTECTWSTAGRGAVRAQKRAIVRLIDGPRVRYCVGSSDEQSRFPASWSVAADRVVFLPWFHYVSDAELALPDEAGDGIFAGGDSYRDYPSLLQGVRGLATPVRIAVRGTDDPVWADRPENVTVESVPHERFMALMRASRIVAVTLEPRADRSAGQATYLNAMAFGKLVVVSETLGVRDYVEHRRTGLVVPPRDPDALRAALAWALDPANADEVEAIRSRARRVARERYSAETYLGGLLRVVDGLTAEG